VKHRTIGTLIVSCLLCFAVGHGVAGPVEIRQQASSDAPRFRKPSARHSPVRGGLTEVAVDLPSLATGSAVGTLALRVDFPEVPRYVEGAPVVIWVHGGYEEGRLQLELPPPADDLIVINFLFPGGVFEAEDRRSDGVYDYRGLASILALRDVILYAAGRLADDQNRTIDEVVPVRVLHDNIGLVGKSNSGNIIAAVVAVHGDELAGYLRYLIQWESPVSSQIATRDLGRPLLAPEGPNQGDYSNPRYLGYGAAEFSVDFSDLAQDPSGALYRVFHDGNGDGRYTTVARPGDGAPVPDLDLDGLLELDEDFPLDSYPMADGSVCYSRPVTRELAQRELFGGEWPDGIATPAEATAFWDLREAVGLLPLALEEMPLLEGMLLASVRDHVQARLDKPHIRQAFDAWHFNGAWVQINPDPAYLIAVDPELGGRGDLPANTPNTAPASWEHPANYCVPEDIPDADYLLAAVWQMADRAAAKGR
jgi:hypothetical protein